MNLPKVSLALSIVALLLVAGSLATALNLTGSISSLSSQAGELGKTLNTVSGQVEAANKNIELIAQATGVPLANPEQVKKIIEERKLVEAAKAEGKVVWYTSLSLRESIPFKEAFEKRFPGITVDVVRKSSEDLLQLAISEARAGKQNADVWQTAIAETYTLGKTAPFASLSGLPEFAAYPSDMRDKAGTWVVMRVNTFALGYNTKLVKKADLPKQWEGFLDKKWEGKLTLEAEDYNWFANLKQILGAEKAANILKGLAANKVQLRKGHTATMELVSAGEIPIMLNANTQRVEEMKAKKAPVDWVAIEPIPTETHVIIIFKNAPHPNAAKVFVNWFLSVEGQRILAELGRLAGRSFFDKSVPVNPPTLTEGLKFSFPDPAWLDKYTDVIKEWKTLLGVP